MNHPLGEATIDVRCAYVVGIVLLAMQQKEINQEQKKYIMGLVNKIGLDETYLAKIWEVGKNSGTTLDNALKSLYKEEYQYCFLIEVYNFIYKTLEYGNYLITTFYGIAKYFNMSKQKVSKLEELCSALVVKNVNRVNKCYKVCMEEGVLVKESNIAYFLENEHFKLLKEQVLQNGEVLIINKEYHVKGIIKVLEGAKLIFDHANVILEGQIQVDKGSIEIRDSFFKNNGEESNYMLVIHDTNLRIERSAFDGTNLAGVLYHSEGDLRIYNSVFENTYNNSAISLWNTNCIIKDTEFRKCNVGRASNGGAIYTNKNLQVTDCLFEDCFAYMGAAIYRIATSIPVAVTGQREIKGRHTDEKQGNEVMLKMFSNRVDFIPMPKNIQLVRYSMILEGNRFINCKACQKGIVSLYKNHTLINKANTFKNCQEPNVYQYE